MRIPVGSRYHFLVFSLLADPDDGLVFAREQRVLAKRLADAVLNVRIALLISKRFWMRTAQEPNARKLAR